MFNNINYYVFKTGIKQTITVTEGNKYNIPKATHKITPRVNSKENVVFFVSEIKCYNIQKDLTMEFEYETHISFNDDISILKNEKDDSSKKIMIELEFVHMTLLISEWRNAYASNQDQIPCPPFIYNIFQIQNKYMPSE